MFVLKVGTKMYYGKDGDRTVLYYDPNDEHVERWDEEIRALQDGKKIFNDPNCNKFHVEEWVKPRRKRRARKKVVEEKKVAEEEVPETDVSLGDKK